MDVKLALKMPSDQEIWDRMRKHLEYVDGNGTKKGYWIPQEAGLQAAASYRECVAMIVAHSKGEPYGGPLTGVDFPTMLKEGVARTTFRFVCNLTNDVFRKEGSGSERGRTWKALAQMVGFQLALEDHSEILWGKK